MAATGTDPATAPGLVPAVRTVPAHHIPPPTTVSPELQARIAAGTSIGRLDAIPTDNRGWDALYNPDPAANRARIERLLAEHALQLDQSVIDGVRCYTISPDEHRHADGPLLVNFHGGGYVGGAGEAGLNEALFVAAICRQRVLAVDYRMAPDHPYPAAVDDAEAVWRAVSSDMPAERIGMFGTSAGGAIILCLLQRLIGRREATPGAIVGGTPWSDLTETGDSYFVHKYADDVKYAGSLQARALQYAGGLDLADPKVSPVYGDFAGFPPTLLISGTRDLFLSNTVRVERKLRDAGCAVSLIVYEGQGHGRYLSGLDVPETRIAAADVGSFMARHLDRSQRASTGTTP